jgi:NitT/TauT family transport system permease protein
LRCTREIDTDGYGPLYKTVVVFIMTLFPILLNTTSVIRSIDNSLVRMARSFRARDLKIFIAVTLPSYGATRGPAHC